MLTSVKIADATCEIVFISKMGGGAMTLRDKLADELFARNVGDRDNCERMARVLVPIVREHSARVAGNVQGMFVANSFAQREAKWIAEEYVQLIVKALEVME